MNSNFNSLLISYLDVIKLHNKMTLYIQIKQKKSTKQILFISTIIL